MLKYANVWSRPLSQRWKKKNILVYCPSEPYDCRSDHAEALRVTLDTNPQVNWPGKEMQSDGRGTDEPEQLMQTFTRWTSAMLPSNLALNVKFTWFSVPPRLTHTKEIAVLMETMKRKLSQKKKRIFGRQLQKLSERICIQHCLKQCIRIDYR